MPTKPLPVRPNLEHLKHQAKDLLKARDAGDLSALQRIREFHPRFAGVADTAIRTATFTLADAQLSVAREYGFASWARLRHHASAADASTLQRPHHERIADANFRLAVDMVDDGDIVGLRTHLTNHPGLISQHVEFEGGNYFRNPALLEFVAENPIRHDSLPPNIVDVARVILDAGARDNRHSIDSTLMLVSSGRVPRECGVQVPLINVLCDYGADPNRAMVAAAGHGEWAALDALIRRGGAVDMDIAAAMGRIDEVRRMLAAADDVCRHRAFAWASQYGHVEIVRLLLDAGEDPNRYNPEGTHSHSTPLHQAALAGHMDVVRLLVERGARLDIQDIHHHGTPLQWAEHGERADVAKYLRERRDLRG